MILRASYRRVYKDVHTFTSLLPFFGTDYGLCTLIKPQITFDPDLAEVPFSTLMTNYTKSIQPGIQLGKENGLSILLDAEVNYTTFSKHFHKAMTFGKLFCIGAFLFVNYGWILPWDVVSFYFSYQPPPLLPVTFPKAIGNFLIYYLNHCVNVTLTLGLKW